MASQRRGYGSGSIRLALKRSKEENEKKKKKENMATEADLAFLDDPPPPPPSLEIKKKPRKKRRRQPSAPTTQQAEKKSAPSKRKRSSGSAVSKKTPKRSLYDVDPTPSPTVEAGSAGPALCLGMVYANVNNTGSQAMRDRPRLVAMERCLGYEVHTIDITHDPKIAICGSDGASRHVNANWNASNRFFKTIWDTWTGKEFTCVVMDYVRTPTGWTASHITKSFYKQTLPRMSTILSRDGRIFLPNLPGIYSQIKKTAAIKKLYYIRLVKPEDNPLFRATSNAREDLRRITGYTNEGEVGKLCFAADTSRKLPFIMLMLRDAAEDERKRIERAKKRKETAEAKAALAAAADAIAVNDDDNNLTTFNNGLHDEQQPSPDASLSSSDDDSEENVPIMRANGHPPRPKGAATNVISNHVLFQQPSQEAQDELHKQSTSWPSRLPKQTRKAEAISGRNSVSWPPRRQATPEANLCPRGYVGLSKLSPEKNSGLLNGGPSSMKGIADANRRTSSLHAFNTPRRQGIQLPKTGSDTVQAHLNPQLQTNVSIKSGHASPNSAPSPLGAFATPSISRAPLVKPTPYAGQLLPGHAWGLSSYNQQGADTYNPAGATTPQNGTRDTPPVRAQAGLYSGIHLSPGLSISPGFTSNRLLNPHMSPEAGQGDLLDGWVNV
uniref:Uncharacterized protein n=1 Tax=Lotharella globosa TaxID=91324 RepID=A0A7S4DXG4_9EUKA|mmetsp:Transcript_6807/g.13364  ORF Transcript_6807/g.13364 Transcript_6807/m.13364 type:complete len:667 (+) Transcript_6807:71-2071(+)